MNPDIKLRWTAALRSGQYIQGHGSLSNFGVSGTRFHCCLGVLCELAVQDGIVDVDVDQDDGQRIYYGNGEEALLPIAVWHWAGLDSNSPMVRGGDGWGDALTGLNDNGATFTEIADLIDGSL